MYSNSKAERQTEKRHKASAQPLKGQQARKQKRQTGNRTNHQNKKGFNADQQQTK